MAEAIWDPDGCTRNANRRTMPIVASASGFHSGVVTLSSRLRERSGTFTMSATGLTATPFRRDGHEPILHMQCGPVRHRVDAKQQAAALGSQKHPPLFHSS